MVCCGWCCGDDTELLVDADTPAKDQLRQVVVDHSKAAVVAVDVDDSTTALENVPLMAASTAFEEASAAQENLTPDDVDPGGVLPAAPKKEDQERKSKLIPPLTFLPTPAIKSSIRTSAGSSVAAPNAASRRSSTNSNTTTASTQINLQPSGDQAQRNSAAARRPSGSSFQLKPRISGFNFVGTTQKKPLGGEATTSTSTIIPRPSEDDEDGAAPAGVDPRPRGTTSSNAGSKKSSITSYSERTTGGTASPLNLSPTGAKRTVTQTKSQFSFGEEGVYGELRTTTDEHHDNNDHEQLHDEVREQIANIDKVLKHEESTLNSRDFRSLIRREEEDHLRGLPSFVHKAKAGLKTAVTGLSEVGDSSTTTRDGTSLTDASSVGRRTGDGEKMFRDAAEGVKLKSEESVVPPRSASANSSGGRSGPSQQTTTQASSIPRLSSRPESERVPSIPSAEDRSFIKFPSALRNVSGASGSRATGGVPSAFKDYSSAGDSILRSDDSTMIPSSGVAAPGAQPTSSGMSSNISSYASQNSVDSRITEQVSQMNKDNKRGGNINTNTSNRPSSSAASILDDSRVTEQTQNKRGTTTTAATFTFGTTVLSAPGTAAGQRDKEGGATVVHGVKQGELHPAGHTHTATFGDSDVEAAAEQQQNRQTNNSKSEMNYVEGEHHRERDGSTSGFQWSSSSSSASGNDSSNGVDDDVAAPVGVVRNKEASNRRATPDFGTTTTASPALIPSPSIPTRTIVSTSPNSRKPGAVDAQERPRSRGMTAPKGVSIPSNTITSISPHMSAAARLAARRSAARAKATAASGTGRGGNVPTSSSSTGVVDHAKKTSAGDDVM
ncbi:unnamed protein product [Amoebophrya sp. A120]|nr:unnamed protein product [Amoebophrya sp. A120]|eukprot:GSA120T00024821001.1